MNLQEKYEAYIQQREFHKLQAQTLDGAAQAIKALIEEEIVASVVEAEEVEEDASD